ncbi:MAG: sigma-70 family RNA polymerase sigma factor [Bacilli bacterium]|nr:sigma-70 family RNA polymerase sigma factor [Bacilli bacterium]
MYSNENDYELLYLVAEENEAAKDIFYEKYRPLVEMKAAKYFNYVKNKGYELNDLLQEGMIGLSQAIKDFKEQKNVKFVTFASVCIERQILTFIRDVNRQKHKLLNNSLSIDSTEDSFGRPLMEVLFDVKNLNPEDSFINIEEQEELKRKIKHMLTDKEYEVFELRLQGFSYQEISCLLEITVKSVDGAMRRIKSKISNIQKGID